MSAQELSAKIRENISKVIIGKDDVIDKAVIALFCRGHVLLEDIPGTGKTSLAKALAMSVDCSFSRIQFTPDLLPADVTGINFYDRKSDEFRFRKGAVFTNILLADEINRATPRTQSALLECMEERQVTADGSCYPLESPFMVVATQNPIEIQGTFPLPEAQLDRFLMQLEMGYPSFENELDILKSYANSSPAAALSAVATADEIIAAQNEVFAVTVNGAVREYILNIITATRNNQKLRLGVSPRGSLALMRAAQGHAACDGRSYVLPDDVKAMASDVLSHRVIRKASGFGSSHAASAEIINEILSEVTVPTETVEGDKSEGTVK